MKRILLALALVAPALSGQLSGQLSGHNCTRAWPVTKFVTVPE